MTRHTPSAAEADWLAAYRHIGSSTIGHFGREGWLPGLLPLHPGTQVAGRAFTVAVHAPDGAILRDALCACPPGAVLVVACQGEPGCACWGELRTLAALVKGLAGVVVDGPVTDLRALRELPLPIFCEGASAYTTRALGGAGAIEVPVQVRGVAIHPGDLIVGDDDGVQVLRPAQAIAGLPAFQRKEHADAQRRAELRARLRLA